MIAIQQRRPRSVVEILYYMVSSLSLYTFGSSEQGLLNRYIGIFGAIVELWGV